MRIRFKLLALRLAIVPVILSLSIPMNLIDSNLASAATVAATPAQVTSQVQSWWYYTAVSSCLANASGISDADAKAGKWFGNGNPMSGFVMRGVLDGIGDDGQTNCNENSSAISVQALSLWGVSSLDVMCAMHATDSIGGQTGYFRSNGTDCKNGTGGFDLKVSPSTASVSQLFKNAINKLPVKYSVPAANADTTAAKYLSAAQLYELYSKTFQNGCAYKQKILDTKPGGTKVYEFGQYNSTTLSIDDKYVVGTTDSGTLVAMDPTYNAGSNPAQKSCGSLASSTISGSVDANAYLSEMTSSACSQKFSDSKQAAACVDGALHKSDLGYCAKAYTDPIINGSADHPQFGDNSVVREACYVGQGNAGAEGCIVVGGYSTSNPTLLKACIAGAENSDATYCDTAYAGAYIGSTFNARTDEKAACKLGQTVPVTDGSLKGPSGDTNCTANPNTTGCPVNTTCAIPSIGWILCPAINFVSGITDGMYGLVSSLLVTDVSAVSTDSGTFTAWSVMRNFANAGFVLVFLIIIFSQLTGAGITNYGVKKLLPRLIIVAVLVNISFFVCQIAIDVSNIIGGSLPSVFNNIGVFDPSSTTDFGTIGGNILSGAGLVLVAGAGVGAVFFAGVGLLIPILLAALGAILVTLGILVARQVLIVLLVVVAPLAFLAMLLPNTESLFKQWRKITVAMLLVYPMIALLFGASKLASGIITYSGTNSFQQLFGLAALFLPLFLTPVLLKGSLSAIPALGGLATRLQNRANSSLSKTTSSQIDKSRLGQAKKYITGNLDRNRALEQAGAYQGKNPFRKLGSNFNAVINSRTGKFGEKSSAAGVELAQKMQDEEVASAKVAMQAANKGLGFSGPNRQELAMKGKITIDGKTYSGEIFQKAAIQEQLRTGSYDEVAEIVNNSGGSLRNYAQTIAQGLLANGQSVKDPAWSGKNINDISQGRVTSKAEGDLLSLKAIDENKFTPEAFAAMHNTARQRVIDAAKASSDPKYLEALKVAAKGVRENNQLTAKLAGEGINQIANLK